MSDYLLACWVNKNTGAPLSRWWPFSVKHVVRIVTDSSAITVINEFTSGGAFARASCAPSALQSWLLDKTGVRTTMARIEALAHTGPKGTTFENLAPAVHAIGEGAVIGRSSVPGRIMNPLNGFIDPITRHAAYLANRQGGNDCLLLTSATPPPPPPPSTEADMDSFFLEPKGDPSHGDVVELPGVRAGMTIHLASQDRAGASGAVLLVYCETNGKPDANHTFTLKGTVPGKAGPVTGDIATATLAGATSGSVTFMNEAAFRVMVSITVP